MIVLAKSMLRVGSLLLKTDMTGSGGIAGFFRHVSRKDMVEITEKLFGSENIVSWSCHMDEENPHLHVLFVPCHESEISR